MKIDPNKVHKIDANSELFPLCLKDFRHEREIPTKLYCLGNLDLLDFVRQKQSLSIVGTRKASVYAKNLTRNLVAELAKYKCITVSGMAHGIDAQTHISSIEHALPTIAVLGCGLDMISNAAQSDNMQSILENEGLILCDYPLRTRASKISFPARNRIIAAFSPNVVVVEAALGSGSLITADWARQLKRGIFTFPCELGDEEKAGNNEILRKDWGNAIYQIDKFVRKLNFEKKKIRKTKKQVSPQIKILNPVQQEIFAELGIRPVSFDQLAAKLNINHMELLKSLTMLEVQGLAQRAGANKYIKK